MGNQLIGDNIIGKRGYVTKMGSKPNILILHADAVKYALLFNFGRLISVYIGGL